MHKLAGSSRQARFLHCRINALDVRRGELFESNRPDVRVDVFRHVELVGTVRTAPQPQANHVFQPGRQKLRDGQLGCWRQRSIELAVLQPRQLVGDLLFRGSIDCFP